MAASPKFPSAFPSGNEQDTTTIFQENFENTNLSEWKQTTDWEVSDLGKISGNYSLKHSGKAISGISSVFHSLKTDVKSYDSEWSFRLKNGNWDPSSSNRFWFYCCADTILPDQLTGWAVGVNISGSSDLLELWRFKNGRADSLIIQTDLDWDASTIALLKVKRTVRGLWSLVYQKPGQAPSKAFEGIDTSISAFKNIGVYFNFTSTRAGQVWIDDILVTGTSAQPFIEKIELIGSQLIRLTFNKPILPSSIQSGNFRITGESGQSIAVSGIAPTKGSNQSIDISIGKTNSSELQVSVSGISDLSGQTMQAETRTISYSFTPEKGTVLINEVLFNPFTGGVDFVELVNVSGFSVPVHRLKLATRNDTLALKQIYTVSAEKRFLKPGELLVCTKDPAVVIAQYISSNPEAFCTMKSFPTYSDDAGTVVLLNDSLEVLDEFNYSAKMHSPFLANEEGVSLERISLEKPGSDPKNWASAAASVGFATPGLPNSQAESKTEIQDEISCEPKAFSLNSDGYNDELNIQFKFSKPGYIANVRLFDVAGRQVKFLVKNQSLAQEGSWQWDGKTDSGQKLGIGVYIVLVEVFDREGHTKRFKEACTITDRLE
ncbi:MAG: gliding motility-associated C-terminal domain-containing protein [Prolixibacteraceae bacterium]|nr:gliding motility-associated C-terminal domain-containing protein [Prolixibacteraceae bacterium]